MATAQLPAATVDDAGGKGLRTGTGTGIRIRDLSMIYDPAQGPVLDGISLDIGGGQIHGVIGRSGAGKSTLVRTLNGLVRPTSGTITVAGHEITALAGAPLRQARREIAMIFQHFSLMSA
ncbi:MAG TPA: ATP-binding cassette domain-containing protein, partial [Paenirhodobacter sp.]